MASILLHEARHNFATIPGKNQHSMSTMDHNFSLPASVSSKDSGRSSFVESATSPEGAGGESQFLPGGCPAMRSVEQVMRELAAGDAPVLIRAEAGAGKRTAAQRIHEMSIRSSQPFVALDCATLTAEALENSVTSTFCRGTVLLEEVANLTAACQEKLMQVLESGKSGGGNGKPQNGLGSARLVFTTGKDLERELSERRFREDLYYRISGVCLRLPPLRQRRDDIAPLVRFFLTRYATELGRSLPSLSLEAEQRLQDYAWPGNLRELQDVAKAIVVLGDEALVLGGLRGLSIVPGRRTDGKVSLKEASKAASREAEKELILRVLNRTRWNRRRAAQELQISYKALLYKLKQIGCQEYGA